ncbi:hypothetical protein BY458DRAFT_559179 [Sporodiniella umbellata]|nr:hypothetical protein BY458DRAFT_559179 [Sporodiniella umbellata]
MYITSVVASLLLVASYAQAAYPITTIKGQDNFCIFLPPKPGLEVAVNENNGIPFCSKKNTVPKATVFPSGFITTAHYLKTSQYVQITGFFDRTKYNLQESDGGGQYDNHAHGKPVGAQCEGYNYFVNLIEPDIQRFCIRCCKEKSDCNTGRSGYGCLRVVSGDYTNDNNMMNITQTKKSHNHSNNNINSVLADLDALPVTDDSSDVSDSSNIVQEITSKIEGFQSELSSQQSIDQVKSEWATFATQISQTYPEQANEIQKLMDISSVLTTSDQLSTFNDLVLSKVKEMGQGSVTTEPSATLTHTNTQEDLDWLYEHRNSHDNQATW